MRMSELLKSRVWRRARWRLVFAASALLLLVGLALRLAPVLSTGPATSSGNSVSGEDRRQEQAELPSADSKPDEAAPPTGRRDASGRVGEELTPESRERIARLFDALGSFRTPEAADAQAELVLAGEAAIPLISAELDRLLALEGALRQESASAENDRKAYEVGVRIMQLVNVLAAARKRANLVTAARG